jgi:Trk-type K+ transport system membrane component
MALAGKMALCFNMWVGRLEIIPVLILVRSFLARGR